MESCRRMMVEEEITMESHLTTPSVCFMLANENPSLRDAIKFVDIPCSTWCLPPSQGYVKAYWEDKAWVESDTTSKFLALPYIHTKEKSALKV